MILKKHNEPSRCGGHITTVRQCIVADDSDADVECCGAAYVVISFVRIDCHQKPWVQNL